MATGYRNSYGNIYITPKRKYHLLRIRKGTNRGDFVYNNFSTMKQEHLYSLRVRGNPKPKRVLKFISFGGSSNETFVRNSVVNEFRPRVVGITKEFSIRTDFNFFYNLALIFIVFFMITSVLFSDAVAVNAIDNTISLGKAIANFGKNTLGPLKSWLSDLRGIMTDITQPKDDSFLAIFNNPFETIFGGVADFIRVLFKMSIAVVNMLFRVVQLVLDILSLVFGGF